MSNSFARRSLTAVVLGAASCASPPRPGHAARQPGEAGARDRLPRVDAASQQARLAYWTRALATLDGIPFDELSYVSKKADWKLSERRPVCCSQWARLLSSSCNGSRCRS